MISGTELSTYEPVALAPATAFGQWFKRHRDPGQRLQWFYGADTGQIPNFIKQLPYTWHIRHEKWYFPNTPSKTS